MATLKGKTISETYPLLLKIASSGVDGTLRNVEDGDGTASALQISSSEVNINGGLTASGDITGTLATAAQTNITSVGTLTALSVDGNINLVSANDAIVAGSSNILQRTSGGYITIGDSSWNEIRLNTTGSTDFVLDNSGNVGIGTTSPDTRLTIAEARQGNSSSTILNQQILHLDDTTTWSSLHANKPTGGGVNFSGVYNSSNEQVIFGGIRGLKENNTDGNYDGALVFGTIQNGGNMAEKLRITSAGDVMLGNQTMTDHTYQTLGVRGDSSSGVTSITLLSAAANSSQRSWAITSNYSAHGNLDFKYSSDRDGTPFTNTAMIINSSGNVGIGHTSPQFGLTLAQGDTDAQSIGWEDGSNNKRASIYCGTSDDSLRFHVANADRLHITTAGRVIQKNTSLANSCFDIINGNASGFGLYIKAGSSSTYALSVNDYNGSNLMVVNGNGNVGIGTTSPDATLAVSGTLLGGGQRFATSGKSVNVGSSTTFDISGSSSGFVFVKILVKVGWNGNASYQMHSMYEYVTSNYATTGGTATRSDIVQVEAGNAQFNYSDISISRPSDRTVRLTYAPSSGSGSHTCSIYVSGVFDSLS